jgi:hypothetical protein
MVAWKSIRMQLMSQAQVLTNNYLSEILVWQTRKKHHALTSFLWVQRISAK